MAQITTNVNEKVYQIKNWLGVNQALEGDSRLKYGEAAVMENFRVTAGGALQKRPGTKNVAGLVSAYGVEIDTDSKQLLFAGEGESSVALEMAPRAVPDDTGRLELDGDAETVDATNAAERTGWFTRYQGEVWQLAELRTVSGGVELGELTRFSTGSATSLGGDVGLTGTQSITTYSQISNSGGVTAPTGSTTERSVSLPAEANTWQSENVGGYIQWGGINYRFYGIKTGKCTSYGKWLQYHCKKTSTTTVTGYSEGSWESGQYWAWEGSGFADYSGFSSYSFNSSTGLFSTAGEYRSVSAESPGTIYEVSSTGKVLYRYVADAVGFQEYSKKAVESGSSTQVSYALGSYVGPELVPTGEQPPGTYETTQVFDGKVFTVTLIAGKYYAFTPDTEDSTVYYDAHFEWWGYPVTVEPGTYEWYFYPARSAANDADAAVRGIWSGYVKGREVLCAACNGHLWELLESGGEWSKVDCGSIDTTENVHLFGFEDKLYLLNGSQYKVWDGDALLDVEGYRPLVAVAIAPEGGGTQLEQVNKLSSARRAWLAPNGEAASFKLPEAGIQSIDYVLDRESGSNLSAESYSADLTEGIITFGTAPAEGVNTLEVGWSAAGNGRAEVFAMRFAELYNGAQDSRVFLYGDGSNKALYSDLDYDGRARADYFPDLNVIHVGDSNTPLTALIRHYSRLLAFKQDSAYSIYYDTLGLADGSVAAAFYVTPVNRDMGNCAPGQAVLVDNRPRTLDGRSVVEWKATTTSGNITSDSRNGQRISQRVASTIKEIDLTTAITFYDKVSHEYYVIGDEGMALVHNVDADAWYVYTNFAARRLVLYKDDLYYGTADGWLRHVSADYTDDNGQAIEAVWESGSMDFGEDYRRKYSAMLWIGIKPEERGYLEVSAETDQRSDFAVYPFSADNVEQLPTMNRIKLKAKKFTFYKLKLRNAEADKTATVVSADIRVRSTGYVR